MKDEEVFHIGDIKVEAFLVPGHMIYLIDDAYLFTEDTIWFGVDGGYSFIFCILPQGSGMRQHEEAETT